MHDDLRSKRHLSPMVLWVCFAGIAFAELLTIFIQAAADGVSPCRGRRRHLECLNKDATNPAETD
jgi:hypothetical protein